MNIAITVDDRQLSQALRKAPRMTVRKLKNWVNTTGALVERVEKQEVPVDTGVLQNSIHAITSGLKSEIKPNVKYALPVHEGTGLYGPKHRLITPVRSKFLVFEVGGKTIFARSIKGQKPNKFADRTYKSVKPQAEQEANKVLTDIVSSI